MITSARSVRPSVRPSARPSNPSPWNLGWHLVNRERRRHSPFCTNFGLPAASERGPPQTPSPPWGPLGHRARSISLLISLVPLASSREREITRASFLSARGRIDYGSSPPRPRNSFSFPLPPLPVISSSFFTLLIISFASRRESTRPLFP